KTPIPYMSHLLGVCSLVLEHDGDEEQAIAALLHDSIEDHGDEISLEDIAATFGDRVGMMVAGCTDSFADPKPSWRKRKETYTSRLGDEPADVLLVSYCDK